jgi:signal transduction histidine kinase
MSPTPRPIAGPTPSSANPGDLAHATRLRRQSWAFTATLLLVTWAAVAALLQGRWTDTLAQTTRQNTNLSRALQEQTARVLASTDQACLRVRDEVAAGNRTPDLARFANETGLAPKILVQLSLIGPDGHFQGSNLDPDGSKTGPVDLSQREHVQAHLAPGASGVRGNGLFIGKPVLGKVSKRWTIQVSRVIRGGDGQALGVVVASLDPAYFEDVYQRVDLGRLGGVTLAGTDMNIRARVIGGAPVAMGQTIGASSGFRPEQAGSEGHYVSRSAVDGVERIYSYRQVGDYPLYIFVFSALEEATAGWRYTRNITVLLAGLVTLAVLGAAAIFLDSLNKLEASHRALRESEAQAQSANKAKSEFLAAISHELRTPLTSIRGFAELMEHRLDDPRFKEQAGLIRKAAEHLATLLNEILDLARVEAGVMPMNPTPEALRPLLQGTCDFFAMPASSKGLGLSLEVAPDVPATLRCDGLRLKQVLNNLLSNAIKFTHQGHITVAVDTAPGLVRFHVVDTGPGIPPEKHELVFERFRQGDDRVSYEHGGTGLGLSLSRALAQLMGGTLTLQSALGQGARFTLSLPADL